MYLPGIAELQLGRKKENNAELECGVHGCKKPDRFYLILQNDAIKRRVDFSVSGL